MKRRNVYLKMKPLEEARRLFLEAFDWTALVGSEQVSLDQALGRITARPVFAAWSVPAYHGAAMDGVALPAEKTFGASEERPVRLELEGPVQMVNTGQPLPEGADAVVMIEQVHQPDPHSVELRAPAFPWQHVRRVGEDIVAGEMLLAHHQRLGAAELTALAMAGVFQVEVLCRPQVAVIPTGGELVDWRRAPSDPPPPGRILETNSLFLASLVRETGGEAVVYDPVPDHPDQIRAAVEEALAAGMHLVLLNAGASAGSRDYTARVLDELGQVLVHGVAVMPGKPSILARVKDRPVAGTPGYPVSAWVCFDRLLRPALELMQGRQPSRRPTVPAIPARRLASRLGQEELIRVHLGRVGEKVVATPLKRGAGTITSLTRADGILAIPPHKDGLEEGSPTTAELLVPPEDLDHTLVIVGSHDITLDLMADHMKRIAPWVRVSSSHLGSLAGLMAIAAGRCHLGGTHLLDPKTGDYNVSYVKRYLKDRPARLLTLALRQQGLMVKPGNPKGIGGIADLAREDVTFVNRQPGSGTRVLLDHHLKQAGIDPARIRGYDHHEYTHMAVAVAVLAGGADAGLGILAAARALGLDFIPLMTERYDLCIPLEFWDDPRVQILRQTLRSQDFRRAVEKLGGYDTTPMGEVAWKA